MSVGIGAKLWVNFSVILVLLAGVAGFGLLQLQAAEATMDVLTSQRFPAVEAALQIPEAIRSMQRDLRDRGDFQRGESDG
jgi:CHASE3 domain sensor protein